MSTDEYKNAVWEIHQEVSDELTVLFEEFNEKIEAGDMKEESLRNLELAQNMEKIFNDALGKLEALEAPGKLEALHQELRDYYQEGVYLGQDLADAYDHLYEISGLLGKSMPEGLSIFELDLATASSQEAASAIDHDIVTLKKFSQEVSSASPGSGLMEGFDAFLEGFFNQLADTMLKYREPISTNQPGARDALQDEMGATFDDFDQQMAQGPPGLGELLSRRNQLKDRYYELQNEINAL